MKTLYIVYITGYDQVRHDQFETDNELHANEAYELIETHYDNRQDIDVSLEARPIQFKNIAEVRVLDSSW